MKIVNYSRKVSRFNDRMSLSFCQLSPSFRTRFFKQMLLAKKSKFSPTCSDTLAAREKWRTVDLFLDYTAHSVQKKRTVKQRGTCVVRGPKFVLNVHFDHRYTFSQSSKDIHIRTINFLRHTYWHIVSKEQRNGEEWRIRKVSVQNFMQYVVIQNIFALNTSFFAWWKWKRWPNKYGDNQLHQIFEFSISQFLNISCIPFSIVYISNCSNFHFAKLTHGKQEKIWRHFDGN